MECVICQLTVGDPCRVGILMMLSLWRHSGSAVECCTLDRENPVMNPVHIMMATRCGSVMQRQNKIVVCTWYVAINCDFLYKNTNSGKIKHFVNFIFIMLDNPTNMFFSINGRWRFIFPFFLVICHGKTLELSVTPVTLVTLDLQVLFKKFEEDDIPVLEMSTLTEEGLSNVKTEVRIEILYVALYVLLELFDWTIKRLLTL